MLFYGLKQTIQGYKTLICLKIKIHVFNISKFGQ